MLSVRRPSCMPSSHRVLTAAIPCWPGRQEPSLTGYNVCWMPQPVSSVILGSSTGARPGRTSHLLHSELHWLDVPQRILHKLGVTVHRCLQGKAPQYLVNCCHPTSDVTSRQRLRSFSRHHLVVPRHRRSTLGRSPSPVRWPGMRCLTTSETRRSVPTISGRS